MVNYTEKKERPDYYPNAPVGYAAVSSTAGSPVSEEGA